MQDWARPADLIRWLRKLKQNCEAIMMLLLVFPQGVHLNVNIEILVHSHMDDAQ